jgi:TetR/AcrR family fatty acid metabolism transcriptional regulator
MVHCTNIKADNEYYSQEKSSMAGVSSKKRILDAAEEIMAEKGMGARISEIALKAGVKDSVIYHYFKNKEDLLFSIAEERLKDIREQMEDQLLGISDPLSQLRKLVHFRLHYLEKNRNYGDLLLFECRSSMTFYSHPAFDQAKWFMVRLGKILKQGMEAGVFRSDLNVWLVRDAVFGLMDLANIKGLLAKEESQSADFERIFDLIQPMVMNHADQDSDLKDKRKRILLAAERMFSEKGYENATIQDIAASAGVGDGTVYDYFKNKEDLLFNTLKEGFQPSSLKKGFQDHLKSLDQKTGDSGPLEKLEQFIRRKFLICLTQPNFAKIFILNGVYNKSFYQSDAYDEFNRYMNTLDGILSQGKTQNLFRFEADPLMFRYLVLGAFSHLTLRWLVSEKKAALDKAGEINAMTALLIRSILNPLCSQ